MNNYFSYFFEWLKIDLKANLEYKINLVSHLSIVFIDTIITLFSFYVLKKNFDFFILSQNEILFFVFNMYFIYLLFGSFAMSKNLSFYIIKGDLNVFLTKPRNIFFQYFLKTTRSRRFITTVIMFVLLLSYVFYFNVSFFKFLITLFFSFIGGALYLIIICFFDSFAFYMKKGNFLYQNYRSMNDSVQYFPYSFMDKFKFSKFLLLLPVLFYGSVTAEYLFGYRTFLEILYLSYFILFFIICFSFGTWILWKIGLKTYEGFG